VQLSELVGYTDPEGIMASGNNAGEARIMGES
jgi:hypothetical protein